MRKVLIIVYYWPPSGGGGVQRWLKFAKYLPQYDWEPVVFAPENADYPLTDESLLDDISPDLTVIKQPIFEIRKLYTRFARKKTNSEKEVDADAIFYADRKNLSLMQRLALYVRSNMFIPDARKTWIKPSVKRLTHWLQENKVDAIITTGPPHSCHLIGLALKQKFGLPWIADFRDPWTDIEFFEHMNLSDRSRQRHHLLQGQVMQNADCVTTVSWSWARLFQGYGASRTAVITNGFDATDFPEVPEQGDERAFRISYLGTLEKDRDPEFLWKEMNARLSAIEHSGRTLELHFAGKIDSAILDRLPEDLKNRVRNHGYVDHASAIRIMQESDVLILIQNKATADNVKGRIPGKVFEYMATGNAILMIGDSSSDLATIVQKLPNSCIVSEGESEELGRFLVERSSTGRSGATQEVAHEYERKHLTERLAQTLEDLMP